MRRTARFRSPRFLAHLALRLATRGLLVVSFVACGGDGNAAGPAADASSEGGSMPPDASLFGDGGSVSAPDARSPNPPATACTNGPFVGFSTAVTTIPVSGAGDGTSGAGPLQGVTVSFTSCAGFELTTDGTGAAQTQLTKGVLTSPFFSKPGYVGTIGAELAADRDAYAGVVLFSSDPSATRPFPGYDPADAMMHLVIQSRATAPCDQVSGVKVAVVGHPEAVVHYMSADWPSSIAEVPGEVSAGKDVFIGGLKGPARVTLEATKASCNATASVSPQTGAFVLTSQLVSTGTIFIGQALK